MPDDRRSQDHVHARAPIKHSPLPYGSHTRPRHADSAHPNVPSARWERFVYTYSYPHPAIPSK